MKNERISMAQLEVQLLLLKQENQIDLKCVPENLVLLFYLQWNIYFHCSEQTTGHRLECRELIFLLEHLRIE